MSKPSEPSKDPVFSFEPDTIGEDPSTGHTRITVRNSYKAFSALGTGEIYFTPKDGRFWIGPGKECPQETFDKVFASKLRWAFDEFEEKELVKEVEVEIEAADGKKRKEKERRVLGTQITNKFPCTTKNILKKRTELAKQAIEKGVQVDYNEIIKATSPTHLEPGDAVKKQLESDNLFSSAYSRIKQLLRN